MKKIIFAGLISILLVGTIGAAVVFAQGPEGDPETPWGGACNEDCPSWMGRWNSDRDGAREFANPLGRMGDFGQEGRGLMEDYVVPFAAEKLGLSAEEIESRLEAGETLAEIAESMGVEDNYAFMDEAREYARGLMVEDGVEMPGWARWDFDSGLSAGAKRFAPRGEVNPEQCGWGSLLQGDGTAVPRGGRGRRLK